MQSYWIDQAGMKKHEVHKSGPSKHFNIKKIIQSRACTYQNLVPMTTTLKASGSGTNDLWQPRIHQHLTGCLGGSLVRHCTLNSCTELAMV